MKIFFALLFLSVFSGSLFAVSTNEGLENEIYLHPLDGFTAYTLSKNEFSYNQSMEPLLAGIPLPSWAWWGITDRLTAEIDLQAYLFLIPSFNFRYAICGQEGRRPAITFETMIQIVEPGFEQTKDDAAVTVIRGGANWYNHLNFSWKLGSAFRLHFSAGATFAEELTIQSSAQPSLYSQSYTNHLFPDVSVSFDWRPAKWVSIHATASYGSTFVYLDNIPAKLELAYGFRFAPFYKSRLGFFNTFRIETPALFVYFPDAKEWMNTYIPLPQVVYFYWQWQM